MPAMFLINDHDYLLFALSLHRDFVGKYYPVIKSSNPHLPVLIRECSGVSPRIWARLDHGRESSLEAGDKSPDNIWKELLALVQPEKGT